MNSSAKKIKNNGPAMIPALSLNGLDGIASGIDIENFNCCLSVHQMISPIIYFCMKNEGLFPVAKIPSDVGRISESTFVNISLDGKSFYILKE